MKKINFLVGALLVCSLGFAQEQITTNGDFETGDATGWSGNAANVVTENGNSYNSANVTTAGNAWDVNLSYVLELEANATYVLSFDAWSDQSRTILAGIGLNEDPWSNTTETVTLSTTSETYTYTLVAPGDVNTNSRVIFDMGADVGFVGIDNVSLVKQDTSTGGGTSEAPMTAAPDPTVDASRVKSVFSGVYDNLTVTEWGPNWGTSSARITDVDIDGNATKLMTLESGQTFAGIDFSGDAFDATEYEYLHMDVWVADPLPTGQVFSVKLSNHDGGTGETSAIQYTPSTLTAGSWMSFDMPLDDFTDAAGGGIMDRNAIAQIVITAARADGTEVVSFYLDNIYFYSTDELATDDITASDKAVKLYPNPVVAGQDVVLSGDVASVEVYTTTGQVVKVAKAATFSTNGLNPGVYFVKFTTENGKVQAQKLMVK